jgi:hypothetical protein
MGMSLFYPNNSLTMFTTRTLLMALFVALASVPTLAAPADEEGTHIQALDISAVRFESIHARPRDCPTTCSDGYVPPPVIFR